MGEKRGDSFSIPHDTETGLKRGQGGPVLLDYMYHSIYKDSIRAHVSIYIKRFTVQFSRAYHLGEIFFYFVVV